MMNQIEPHNPAEEQNDTPEQSFPNDLTIFRVDSEGGGPGSRFYEGVDKDGNVHWSYPSVTTILGDSVPSGHYLAKWQRDHGLYAQVIFEKAGEDGTEVHKIIEDLLNGHSIQTDNLEKKILKCVSSFIDWFNEFNPKIISTEKIVVNHEEKYAGGCDFVCELDYEKGKEKYVGKYVIDWKTSNAIHESHKHQAAAYQRAVDPNAKAALVQLGSRHKAGYNFVPVDVEEEWETFKLYNKVFRKRNPNARPKKAEYPKIFSLNLKKDEGSVEAN